VTFTYRGGYNDDTTPQSFLNSLYSCDICGALVMTKTSSAHESWHAAQSLTDVTEVRTEAERDPEPCSSIDPSNRRRCWFSEGHAFRHQHENVRWTDEEAARG